MSSHPLYLNQIGNATVDLDAANRITVAIPGKSMRTIPLHLVSRIVCRLQNSIGSRLLVECMKQGIPVSFVDKNGSPTGWCLGVRRIENTVGQLMRHALDDPSFMTLYLSWLASQHQSISSQVMLECGLVRKSAHLPSIRATLCNAHKEKHQAPAGRHLNSLSNVAIQELAAVLSKEIGDPSLLAWTMPGYNLINDLGQILKWHSHNDVHHCTALPMMSDLNLWATKLYEQKSSLWQLRISHLKWSFEQFLRQHWL